MNFLSKITARFENTGHDNEMITAGKTVEKIPKDWEVQPLKAGQKAKSRATCGYCHLSWDDGISTGMTPTPSGRCPFENFHIYERS